MECSAEGWRRLNPSHSARHGNAVQLQLPRAPWQNDAEPQTILGLQEQPVEPVLDVVFARAHWAMLGVGVSDVAQHPIEGMSKLHGLGWRMWLGHFVDGRPTEVPRVVTQESRALFPFLLDCSRGEHQLGQVSHLFVGQHNPEVVLNVVSHFLPWEVCMFVGRMVAALGHSFVLLLGSPGLDSSVDRHPFVSPLGQ